MQALRGEAGAKEEAVGGSGQGEEEARRGTPGGQGG